MNALNLTKKGLFQVSFLIISLALISIIVNIVCFVYFLKTRKTIEKNTGNVLQLFLDIPRRKVESLERASNKFYSFCKVRL